MKNQEIVLPTHEKFEILSTFLLTASLYYNNNHISNWGEETRGTMIGHEHGKRQAQR